jgi:hypothetical protein
MTLEEIEVHLRRLVKENKISRYAFDGYLADVEDYVEEEQYVTMTVEELEKDVIRYDKALGEEE